MKGKVDVRRKGRLSAAANLITVAPLQTQPRLLAPHDLTDEEVEIWRGVVDAQPADWFSYANSYLLTQLCRHAIQARRIGQLIEKATSSPDLKIRDYHRLLAMQKAESEILATLATKMRLAQHSITNHRGNLISEKKAKAFKPWEG